MVRIRWPVAVVALAAWCLAVAASPPEIPRPPRDESRDSERGVPPGLFQPELRGLARELKRFLDARGRDSVALGAFTGPAATAGSAGAGIVAALAEELARQGVLVKRRAELGLSGTYRAVEDAPRVPGGRPGRKTLRAVLSARLEDQTGTLVREFRATIADQSAIARLFGLSFQFGSADLGNGLAIQDTLLGSYELPRPAIDGSLVRARADSPYALEILVKGADGKYTRRAAREEDGLAFVPLRRGEAYSVRLTNGSDYDAAAVLTIDGLSMFAFSERKGNAPQLIIGPRRSATVLGWHRTDEVSDEFLITSYAKGAAAELSASAADVGMITATFAAAWQNKRPDDEPPPPPQAEAAPATDAADATGRGKQVSSKYARVSREVGVLRAAVSVRYTKQ
jgi:hypothetical protein